MSKKSYKPINMTRSLFKTVSVAATVGLIVLGLGIFLIFERFISSLPDVTNLKSFHHEVATQVFSDEGTLIGEFTTERRYPVQFEAIPKHVIQAFLAAEDAKFYEHGGVDFGGIGRAIISNILKGRYAQGGSTITQQVARSILLTRKKELSRKVKEMILAYRMEKELSKNEILALYLSEIYLGHGAFGIEAAARNYFNKHVQQLTVAEASILAGLPQRPNEWDPFRNPYLAKRRQRYVLKRMADEKFITEEQAAAALNEPLRLYALEELNNKAAPYFTEYVRQYLMSKYGSENVLSQGFKVYTTVRYDFQKQAELSMDKGLRAVDQRLGWRGVKNRVASAEELAKLLDDVHGKVIEKITRVRVLAATTEQTQKRLDYDLQMFQAKGSPYFGTTPVAEGQYYTGVVGDIDDTRGFAHVWVGHTTVVLPLATMDWVKIEEKPIKAISQVLHPNDIITVKVAKIDRKNAMALATLEQEPEVQGAMLSYDVQSGMVRAMVGGRDFELSKFNRALHAKRQVGSTFKPLIYAAAIDKGFSPASVVTDSPLVFKFDGKVDADSQGEDWRPRNYEGKFVGDIPLRLALIRSMNIPTVKVLNEITIDYGIQYARTLGITAALPRDLSIGLGSWSSSLEEIMRAYAIFPRLGKPVVLNYIKKVLDEKGQVLEELPAEHPGNAPELKDLTPPSANPDLAQQGLVISPQTAYVMTDMLKGVIREGTGHGASSVPASVAGKTGTSNDQRDAWFVGYTPYLVSGVWVGFDKDKPLDTGETGGRAAAPIWAEFMTSAVKYYPKNDFPIPDDIVFAYINKDTGHLASAVDPRRVRTAFKVGTVPNRDSSNLPRIGEPGTTRVNPLAAIPRPSNTPGATPGTPAPASQGGAQEDQPSTEKQEDTGDFLREGYNN